MSGEDEELQNFIKLGPKVSLADNLKTREESGSHKSYLLDKSD